jgi:MurNAc alpha-1-phosphate uridylyltransferase
MVLAAGRGERMRPLTLDCPKPLLRVGGKPLLIWQIERLARAGFDDLVINVSYLAERITSYLGDGRSLGVRIRYSHEAEPLESAGGIGYALPLLGDGPVLVVASDVYTEYDYANLAPARRAIAAAGAGNRGADADAAAVADAANPAAAANAGAAGNARSARHAPRAHLVLVPNPPFRPAGDYALSPPQAPFPYGRVGLDGSPRWTWTGIGIFGSDLLREIPFGQKIPLLPFFIDWIGRGVVSGELYDGVWDNLGTPDQLHRLDARLSAQRGP